MGLATSMYRQIAMSSAGRSTAGLSTRRTLTFSYHVAPNRIAILLRDQHVDRKRSARAGCLP